MRPLIPSFPYPKDAFEAGYCTPGFTNDCGVRNWMHNFDAHPLKIGAVPEVQIRVSGALLPATRLEYVRQKEVAHG